MICPFCRANDNHVVDSRVMKDGSAIRRRRECVGCERRFTTYERVEESAPIIVKKDGAREAFSRAKLISGISKACEKRPVPTSHIEAFVERLESRLSERPEREVASGEVGERVMEFLRRADQVAYVRFASVYRSFKDIGEFMSQLESLLEQTQIKGGARASGVPSDGGSSADRSSSGVGGPAEIDFGFDDEPPTP